MAAVGRYDVGTAYLTVVPSFRDVERELKNIARNIGRQVNKSIADAIPEGFNEGTERAHKDMERAGKEAGERYAGAWRRTMDRHLSGMVSKLGEDTSAAIKDVRDDLNELRNVVIKAEVDSDFAMLEFRRIQERIRELSRGENTIEMHFNLAEVLREAEQIERAAQRARDNLEEAHEQAEREDRQRSLDRARRQRELNEGARRFVQEENQRALDAARRQRELNESTRRFLQEQNRLEEQAYAENRRRDEEEAQRALNAARDRLRRRQELNEGARRFVIEQQRMLREAYEANDRFDRERARRRGGAFGEQSRRRIGGVLEALPDLEPRFRTTNVLQEMGRIRSEFERLNRLEIDVDLPATQWMGELAQLEAALEALERNQIDIPTDIDLGNIRAARAEIAALRQAARRDGQEAGDEWGGSFVRNIRQHMRALAATISDLRIDINTTPAQFALGELRARMQALGNARIGVDMDLAQFLAEMQIIERELAELEIDGDVDIQTRLEAAATRAGLVQLHRQINQIDEDDINVDVDTDGAMFSMRRFADTVGVSMSRLGLLISLGASIGTAIVPAAAAVAASFSAIAVAAATAVAGVGVFALGVFGVVKAVQALNQYQNDADKSAQNLSASQARVAGAMDQVQSATQSLRSSQRNLTRAEEEAADAVRDLVRAREEARRQLEDMRLAVKDTALAIRQARLDEAEAKEELDKILANPKATEAEREQARINYEERVLQMEELTLRQQRLSKDEEEARKKGVEGSDIVQAAHERIASAMERVVDAQDSVASSQRAVAAANRALAQSYEKTDIAGGDALRNLREAMDALSPAGQRFALFIFGLKDEFKGLQAAAEEGLLPGLQQAITNLLPYLEPLRGFVGRVAEALGAGFVYATEALKDPVWQEFFSYLNSVAVPVLAGMFEFTLNVAKGIAGIILGLSGFNGPIGAGVLQWSRDFAQWGATLDSNQGWQKFLQYVRDSWPEVRDFFSGLWEFTKKFVAAAAPVGEWVVGAFAKLFEWMNKLDTDTWTIIIAAIAGVGAALLAVAGITSLITTGWAGLIIALIGLIAAEWAILYEKVEPIRHIMQLLWESAVTGFTWMWQNVLQPGLTAWMEYMRVLGTVFMWLWNEIISPVLSWIRAGWEVTWTILQFLFGLIQIGLKTTGGFFLALYTLYVKPLMDWLRPVFKYLAEVFEQQVVPNMKRGLEFLGKAFDAVKEQAKAPIKFIIEFVLNKGLLKAYNAVAKAFGVKPDNVQVDMPEGFYRGGAVHGRGTSTSDSIVARLSNGEHVLTAAEVTKLGGQDQVYRLRSMIRAGVLPGFAAGGAVTKSGDESWWEKIKRKAGEIIGGITDFVSDPIGKIKSLFDKLMLEIPGKGTQMGDLVAAVPKKILGTLMDKVQSFFSYGNSTTLGPIGPGPGFPPWPKGTPGSGFTPYSDSGVWRSIVNLIRSTGPLSGTFGNAYRPGDPLWHGAGRAVDWMGYNQDALSMFFMNQRGRVLELIHRTNRRDYAVTRGQDRGSFSQGLMNDHRNHIHVAMDQGGWLEPGFTGVHNFTGVPEAVLTNKQWNAMFALAKGGDGARAPQYFFEFKDTTLDPGKLRAIQDREEARTRAGRAW